MLFRSVVVSTGDKDMAQLVNERVTLVNTMSGETLDIEGVKEKFGVMDLPKEVNEIFYLTENIGYIFINRDLSGGLFFVQTT